MPCRLSGSVVRLTVAALVVVSIGCRSTGRTTDPRYCELAQDFATSHCQAVDTAIAANPVADELAGPHLVQEYIQIGLQQNSEIQEARLLVESSANRVPQAAALPDPMLVQRPFWLRSKQPPANRTLPCP